MEMSTNPIPSVRIINPRKLKTLPGSIVNARNIAQCKISELFNYLEILSSSPTPEAPSLITLSGADGELLAIAEQNPLPVWIISHPSGTGQTPLIMYANEVALTANHKRAEDLIGESYLQLWEPGSLRQVVSRLWAPRAQLTEYETHGFRFSDSPWDRVGYRFFANYRRLTFMGTPCWQEEILGAEPIN